MNTVIALTRRLVVDLSTRRLAQANAADAGQCAATCRYIQVYPATDVCMCVCVCTCVCAHRPATKSLLHSHCRLLCDQQLPTEHIYMCPPQANKERAHATQTIGVCWVVRHAWHLGWWCVCVRAHTRPHECLQARLDLCLHA